MCVTETGLQTYVAALELHFPRGSPTLPNEGGTVAILAAPTNNSDIPSQQLIFEFVHERHCRSPEHTAAFTNQNTFLGGALNVYGSEYTSNRWCFLYFINRDRYRVGNFFVG